MTHCRPQTCFRALLAGVVVLLLAVALPLPLAYAQDGAHGSGQAAPSASDLHRPGPAVLAPRTTKRYTAQGMTVNPVAIDFDPQGNVYVVEGWRMGKGAAAIVHGPMVRSGSLKLDLQRTTIEQRAAHIESLIKNGFFEREYFTGRADQLRLVKDTDGDGIADRSSVFAGGFNDKLDGVASGVLWHKGKVLFACVPHLWLLEDKDGDGDADKQTPGERTSMSYGYGLRWGYGGHDLHGLIKGPDGRIYFTMGDRGYNIQTKEGKRLIGTDVGSVFRMWPDGSGLEVFATGLRNPQELAFDNYGNLFTGENNCDGGDLARFCFVPEGSDAGWRQDVQSLRSRGAWLREQMWKPRLKKNDPTQPAWIMPPLANVGRGPSGIAHYPGTGDVFPKHGSFLMCDYPAGVRHVRVKPDGASFKVVEDSHLTTTSQSISDVAWGYDGRLYLSDWGGGWGPNDKHGHLKVMVNEAAHQAQAEVIAEVKTLFAEGFEKLSDEKLIELLGHADQRVRIEAQWEIANRPNTINDLDDVIENRDNPELSRLHAVWALAMIARTHNPEGGLFGEQVKVDDETYKLVLEVLYDALKDAASNVRAQAAKSIGELELVYQTPFDVLIAMLRDESNVVQYHAAIALGKNDQGEYFEHLFDLLERNNNHDVVLRHAASYGLSLIGDAQAIHNETKRRGSAARLGGVIALRHLKSPLLVHYIEDEDVQVAAEAVRAIYDQRIDQHLPELAALVDTLPTERMIEPIMRRVIESNIRLANADSANRLAKLAGNAEAPEPWRALALQALTNWSAQRDREDVWGWWLPRPAQTMAHASAAMKTHLPAIKNAATGQALTQARVFELTHILKADAEALVGFARAQDEANEVRMAAMQMLAKKDRAKAVAAAQELLGLPGSTPALRGPLRELLDRLDWQAGLNAYLDALENGTTPERQDAIRKLAPNRSGAAQKKMSQLGRSLLDGTLAPELRLDAYLALTRYNNLPRDAMAAARAYAKKSMQADESPFIRDAVLAGGSIERGRAVFEHLESASCVRCHRMDDRPAAGPRLSGIGARHDVGYLYDALVKPNRDIADGFATSVVTLRDGAIKTGRVLNQKSTAAELVLANADGIESRIPRDQIVGRPVTSTQSLMPTMVGKLNPAQLRDVLAYLQSLKTAPEQGVDPKAGPQILNPAKGLSHAVWLSATLLTVSAALGVILIMTVLGGGHGRV